MSDGSSIEWTEATWNPVRGCDKVSAGCKNCYAETFSERWRGIKGHPFEQGFDLRLVPEALDKPLRWKKPRKIFVNSMSDLFHEKIPNEYIAAVFGVMAACPLHTFQVLTKRAARMRAWFEWIGGSGGIGPWLRGHQKDVRGLFAAGSRFSTYRGRTIRTGEDAWAIVFNASGVQSWPLGNVHLGVSAENQETANERVPLLLECPAAVRWVSAEPLLGPIDGSKFIRPKAIVEGYRQVQNTFTAAGPAPAHLAAPGVDWLVVGGESGPGARPCDLAWIRSIVEQCKAAGTPVFVKQVGAGTRLHTILGRGRHVHDSDRQDDIIVRDSKGGEINEFPEDLRVRQFPRSAP